MQSIQELKHFVIDNCKSYPSLKEEILNLYWVCLSNVIDGNDETKEVTLCFETIIDVIDYQLV
jgi:hypothetical protein